MQVQEAVRSALMDWVHDVGIDVTKGQADKLAKLVVDVNFSSTNSAMDAIASLQKRNVSPNDWYSIGWNDALKSVCGVMQQHQ